MDEGTRSGKLGVDSWQSREEVRDKTQGARHKTQIADEEGKKEYGSLKSISSKL